MREGITTALLSIVMAISGCTAFGGYDYEIKKEEQESEYSCVYAEIIEFKGFRNKEFQSELNLSVSDDVSTAILQFDSLAQDAKEGMPSGVKSTLHITQEVKRNSGGIISFIEEHYIYLGGAHGSTSWYPKTVNVVSANPHVLSLDELFSDSGYMDILNRKIEELVEEHPDKYSELWAEPHISEENKNRFYLTDTDLVIFFPPYELSYYAKGFIEFPIPLSEINYILNEDFRLEK